jgi:hypothetical protein
MRDVRLGLAPALPEFTQMARAEASKYPAKSLSCNALRDARPRLAGKGRSSVLCAGGGVPGCVNAAPTFDEF